MNDIFLQTVGGAAVGDRQKQKRNERKNLVGGTARVFRAREKRSFIVMTILMPFLMAALVLMPMFLAMIKDGDRKTVAVVDNTGLYAPALKSNASYLFVPTEKMTAGMRSDSTDIDAVVHITGNLVDNPAGAAIYSREEIPADLTEYVGAVLTEEARKEKFARYDIPGLDAIIADVQQPVAVATIRWTDDGEQQSMADLIAATGMLLTFLTYLLS